MGFTVLGDLPFTYVANHILRAIPMSLALFVRDLVAAPVEATGDSLCLCLCFSK
jgi:hypothetical protein